MNFENILNDAINQASSTLSRSASCRRFALQISKEDATKLLEQSYRVEVERRGYSYTPNEATKKHLSQVGRWLTDATRKPSLLLYGAQPGTGKTTTAQAIRRMISTLYDQMKASISTAEESMKKEEKKQFSKWPSIPWPEDLSPDEFPGFEGMKKRQEWKKEHPEEAAIIDQKEAERFAAIEEWRIPYKQEIDTARNLAESVYRMQPKYITAQGLADLIKGEDFRGFNGFVFTPFLILDDIGTEPVSVKNYGNEILPLTELLLKRYDSRNPTVITTNLSETAITSIYGPRIMDRLNEICDKIPFGGESFRV